MFFDEEYINEQIEDLKDMIVNDTFEKKSCNNFMLEDDLEDEYSHNDIDEAQAMFMEKARKYLSDNYPGKYAMWRDWCVHIATVDLYREIMWKNNNYREEYRKGKEKRDIIA